MTDFLLIIVAAGLIAFVATPFTLLVARRVGFVDKPSVRKVHLTPVPLLGGVAIYAGLVAGLALFGQERPVRELIGIAGGVTIASAFGLWDDRFGMHPAVKLFGQLLAGTLLIASGVQTRLLNSWLDVPLTLFWIVGICNAINFLDNMDGLAAGLSAVASGSFMVLALFNGQTLVASLAAAVMGACLGFLFYNFSPAITFMGDAGSMALGFMLAVLGLKLEFAGRPPLSTWMVPIVVLGVPILDTTLVVLSRFRRGAAVTQGGTDHTSHRLVRMGMSQRRAVVSLWAVSAALGVMALWMSRSEILVSNLMLGLLGAAGLVAIWIFEDARTLPMPSRRPGLKPDMRVTLIASGDSLAPAIRAATEISHDVRVLLTPSIASEARSRDWRQVSLHSFGDAVVALARQPEAVCDFVLDGHSISNRAGALRSHPPPITDYDLASRSRSATAAFNLKGSLLSTLDTPDTANFATLEAVTSTDLILLFADDLRDNFLPTLAVPGLADALRRTKRPRVLVCRRPAGALAAIAETAGQGIVTHLIEEGEGMAAADPVEAYPVADLANAALVGDVLAKIWLERGRMRPRGAR
ncbi:MAG: hypothetical protein HY260_15360 [Chloroflexi bacterium]|nr:hypothetical protein [Chloroflexota bacterium]